MSQSVDHLPLVILGAGHQGRAIHDLCLVLGRPVRGFLDDTMPPGTAVNGVAVLGGFALAAEPELLATSTFMVGLGHNRTRRRLFAEIRGRGGRLARIIHPSCVVSPSARIGEGAFAGAFTRVLANADIGDFALVEGLCLVGTDCVLGEAAMLGPGAQMTADARLEDEAFVGANAVIIGPSVVGARSIVGACAVVARDVPPDVRALGNPARVWRSTA